MKISEIYREMAQELREEIAAKTLDIAENVQVLRITDKRFSDGYRPIVDWYYADKRMQALFQPDVFDNADDREERKKLQAWYEKDKPELHEIGLALLLNELEKLSGFAEPRICSRRKALGMSVKALSEAAEVTPQYITRLERGERKFSAISAGIACRIAKALEVSVEDLID